MLHLLGGTNDFEHLKKTPGATSGPNCGTLAAMHCMKQKLPATAVLLAALVGSTQFASGQQAPGARPSAPVGAPAARAATGRITGTVKEAGSGKPVSYATVAVLDGAGKMVNGGVAGDDGKFILAGIPAGTYTVQVSFIGYKNEERAGVVVAARSSFL